jgi:hypothetical protein
VDNIWEQEKPEARKMLKNGDESHQSGARFVGRTDCQMNPCAKISMNIKKCIVADS